MDGSPWEARRLDGERLTEISRKFILTLWTTYYFFVSYANVEGWNPARIAPPVGDRPVMARYILAELTDTTVEVDRAMTGFDATGAERRLAQFVDDLSNWYVRRTRGRFGAAAHGASREHVDAAFATLHSCLTILAGLLAPFTPFLAEELYQNLVRSIDPEAPDSVHLRSYPAADEAMRDEGLQNIMSTARQLVTLGRDARARAGVPLRQPLGRAAIAGVSSLPNELLEVIRAALNLKQLDCVTADTGGFVSVSASPNFRALGQSSASAHRRSSRQFSAATPRSSAGICAPEARV